MKRILLVSNDRIGPRMAGPAIRYYHFARELAERYEVTLVAPGGAAIDVDGIDVLAAEDTPSRRFVALAKRHDIVVSQQLSPRTMRALAGTDVKVVYDLYDPLLIETLPYFAGEAASAAYRESAYRAVTLIQLTALTTGDAFVCASERQRDLWLGALAALGRIDVDRYRADADLRALIDVVPYGLEPEPPRADEPVLKGVVPGIGREDRVLIWGGGVWNWFDPLTLIRALGRLAERRDDVKLYFLGVVHPNETIGEMEMAARAVALARELGLEGRHVFFNDSWVPYFERGAYLAEADLGVSAHFDSVETRFAFRTRLLDYFWAGLPTVTTRGDALGDMVGERALGRAVGYEDVDAWVDAIETLLDDEQEYRRVQERLGAVRDELAWPRVVERLAAVCEAPAPEHRAFAAATRLMTRTLAHGVRATVVKKGVRATVADAVRTLRRPDVP